MSERPPDLFEALRVLVRYEVRFVLIGGYAAIARGSPVLTGDVDICYAREDENLQRLAEALRELKAALRAAPRDLPFQPDARTLKEGDHFTFMTTAGPLDCLGTPAGTRGFDDLDQGATEVDLNGLTVRVASLDDLIRMKRVLQRPKDRIALEWLVAVKDELARGAEPGTST